MKKNQSRKSFVVGTVLVVHAVAGLCFLQGCGTTRAPVTMPTEVEMPPTVIGEPVEPVVVQEPVYVPAQVQEPVVKTSVYVIRKGDCLSKIASRYSLSVAEVMTLNNISDPDKIRIGQKLILPGDLDTGASSATTRSTSSSRSIKIPAGGSKYVVKPGDCLSVIAARSGCKTSALRAANGISGDRIIVGQELIIPAGGYVPEKTSPAPVSVPSPELSDDLNLDEGFAPIEMPVEDDISTELALERTHIVTEEDDILGIASQWNVRIDELKKLNRLTDAPLRVGQKLRIPASE